MFHHKLRCTFCRGKYCNRCGPTAFLSQVPRGPIDGLHSNWVTGDVLACQRPSTRIIKEFDLINQFKRNRITAIVNLQEPFEHPFCGDKINKGGFSYRPEEFMDNGIFFYNFPWEDMCTPSLEQMLSIVKVMSMSVCSDNKVAVHCHAGFGRTGMVIACFLLYFRKMTPAEAVRAVRTQRGKCIEKKAQLEYVYDFSQHVKNLQIVFAIHTDSVPFTLQRYLEESQYEYLHGSESRNLRHIPKIVVVLCSLLNQMAGHNAELLGYAFSYVLHRNQWEQSEVARVMHVKEEINEMRDWEKLKQEDPRVLIHLLVDWLRHLKDSILTDEETNRFVTIAKQSRKQQMILPSNRERTVSFFSSPLGLTRKRTSERLLPTTPKMGTSDERTTAWTKSCTSGSTSIECGHEILSLLDEAQRQTIVCVLKVVKKLSKCIMYNDVIDVIASACTHRDFSTTIDKDASGESVDIAKVNLVHETHGLRKSTSQQRRNIRLVFHCMSLAAKDRTLPQIPAFPIDDDSAHGRPGSASNETQQVQMMKDICALYRKLPLGKKNKVLSILAEMYGKALEAKQLTFDHSRAKTKKRPVSKKNMRRTAAKLPPLSKGIGRCPVVPGSKGRVEQGKAVSGGA